jgi:hypothetical protein
MFASIRRYRIAPNTGGEVSRRVQQGFVPIISKAPGFAASYGIEAEIDVVVSITIFQTKAQAEEYILGWIKQYAE